MAGNTNNFWNMRGINSAEWLAENAFLPPGLHRLLTAFGLTSGLWIGRQLTDFVVARRSSDGSEIPRSQVPELLRPLHGVLRYNQYSDTPEDRWKGVADGALPVAFGVVGAYLGSKHFFHGNSSPFFFKKSNGPFHGPSSLLKGLKFQGEGAQDLTLTQIVGKAHLTESDASRPFGATGYITGGNFGGHLAGALGGPGSAATIAIPFQIGAQRNINIFKTGIGFIDRQIIRINRFWGNHAASSRAMPDAINSLIKSAEGNISRGIAMDRWANEAELMKHAQNFLQNFRRLPESEYASVAERIGEELRTIEQLAKNNHWDSQKIYNETKERFSGTKLETLLMEGLKNPESWKNFIPSDHGPVTEMMRVFGYGKQEKGLLENLAKRLNPILSSHYGTEVKINTDIKAHPAVVGSVFTGAALLTTGSLALGAMHHEKEVAQAHETDPNKQQTRHAVADKHLTAKREKHNNAMEWLNDKPLDIAQWFSRVMIQPPSMHRFMNALFLSGTLYGGYKFANVMAGRNLLKIRGVSNAQSLIKKEDVWGIFKPLHGIMEYTPGSSDIKDRWRQALHMIIPVAMGTIGTSAGSHFYFSDRIKKIKSQDSVYLEDYADKVTLEQSKFYAAATGITSIYNTGSGIHLLPFFNYSANMQNRFLMAGGYQVALPGLGKWWSGNEGLYPWGIKRTVNFMANYLAYNPSEFPDQLPSLTHAVLAKLYPNVPNQALAVKERAFIDEIYKVRDTFLHEGQIPKERAPELLKAMKAVVTGAGLEQTLMRIGLDPRQANIANNGVSGSIANVAGQGNSVDRLKRQYVERFTERLAQERQPTENTTNKRPERPLSERTHADRAQASQGTIPLSI